MPWQQEITLLRHRNLLLPFSRLLCLFLYLEFIEWRLKLDAERLDESDKNLFEKYSD
jgi:hypothetical protein